MLTLTRAKTGAQRQQSFKMNRASVSGRGMGAGGALQMEPFSVVGIIHTRVPNCDSSMQPDGLTITPDNAAEPLEEERALVAAARQDPEAAGCLFDKYYPEIFRYLYHSTLDHTATEDLTSNVFFCAFRGLAFFQWRRIPFRAWLYRIATNELRMHYRRQTRARVHRAESDPIERLSELPSADDQAAAADDYQLLHRALLKLGPKHQMIIVLRYFEGKSLSEICEITNKREGTVKSRIHRGLAELRTALLRDGVTLP